MHILHDFNIDQVYIHMSKIQRRSLSIALHRRAANRLLIVALDFLLLLGDQASRYVRPGRPAMSRLWAQISDERDQVVVVRLQGIH